MRVEVVVVEEEGEWWEEVELVAKGEVALKVEVEQVAEEGEMAVDVKVEVAVKSVQNYQKLP